MATACLTPALDPLLAVSAISFLDTSVQPCAFITSFGYTHG